MDGLLDLIRLFLIIYLSPMIANGTPVVYSRFYKGTPIDGGKYWRDGRRILGDGKTFEGSLSAFIAGGLTAGLLGLVSNGFETVFITGVVATIGGITGDIIESFFKRRLGYERGAMLPLADQLDFYLGATLFVLVCGRCLHPSLYVFLFGLIVIPVLHYGTNYIAYKLGLKSVPW